MMVVLGIALAVMTGLLFLALLGALYWREDRNFWRSRSLGRDPWRAES